MGRMENCYSKGPNYLDNHPDEGIQMIVFFFYINVLLN